MKLLFILLVFIFGCNSTNNDDSNPTVSWGLSILVKDSCEYVIYRDINRGSVAMVHHGNCHNPIHKK